MEISAIGEGLAIRPAGIYHVARMPREAVSDSRQEILRTSARLFREQGYDATSMNDISAALKLSDEILFHIMNHAMEITEARVLAPVRALPDPEERLRALIRLHIQLVLRARDREITVILHENHPLPPGLRKRVNARKKEYIHFVEQLILEVQRVRKSRNVTHRAAAFALLGMINWIYQWYRPEGPLQEEDLIRQYTEIFFAGAFQ
ncbi:MAG: TetR/AcrR family transcriptional regulator [Acidobacteria bacterium]|nr:MAG: TetR/AcrR family transcriptional regulator [Acidobacteriota bacterium]